MPITQDEVRELANPMRAASAARNSQSNSHRIGGYIFDNVNDPSMIANRESYIRVHSGVYGDISNGHSRSSRYVRSVMDDYGVNSSFSENLNAFLVRRYREYGLMPLPDHLRGTNPTAIFIDEAADIAPGTEPTMPRDPIPPTERPRPSRNWEQRSRRGDDPTIQREQDTTQEQRPLFELFPLMLNMGRRQSGRTTQIIRDALEIADRHVIIFIPGGRGKVPFCTQLRQEMDAQGIRYQQDGADHLFQRENIFGAKYKLIVYNFAFGTARSLSNGEDARVGRNKVAIFFDDLNRCLMTAMNSNNRTIVGASWEIIEPVDTLRPR